MGQEDKDHIWDLICNKNFSRCILLVDDFNIGKNYTIDLGYNGYCAYIRLMAKVVMHGACAVSYTHLDVYKRQNTVF